ncbi:MAG: alpha-amylase family glycosyl hydrolase [Bacteroidota bacterium]
MKRILQLAVMVVCSYAIAQQQTVTYSISPPTFEDSDNITISFDGTSINESLWGVTNNALYLWSWSFDINDTNEQDCPTNGAWTNSNEANRLDYNALTDTYSITFIPTTFYGRAEIGRIGFLVKAQDGTGDKKSQDILVEVGGFQVTLNSPQENSTTIVNSGGNLAISASNTSGNANYVLKSNGITIDTANGVSTYNYMDMNITDNQNYSLEVTLSTITITKTFSAIVNPGVVNEALPSGIESGINYNDSDDTRAILAVDAPLKDFVYVAGSFNNWQPDSNYAMKKDPSSDKFWIELTGLTPGQVYTYQYWVVDTAPIAGSPTLVKTADPFSTLVLSPFDDPGIPSGSYPNLPAYPSGQEREVTILQTGQTPYNWQVTNFQKPKMEDLIVYEVLVRDFDADRNYQDLIDRIDYFKNLKINAIHLMPVMEYEGNESWGYNTSFHMALDKFYGTPDKLKEFIDLCHQNGIAIILDVVLNHAFGRNPFVRMWMDDPDGDGWGGPSSESPYFNQLPTHSFNVGNDFNHQQPLVQDYVKRVIKQWVEEYKIDGFRWDLTKGFTQNCGNGTGDGNFTCTNGYQQDRVDVLREYADYSWSLDPSHYVIFEHLGTDNEERQWANYTTNGRPGIMLWGKMTSEYNELTMSRSFNKNITRMGHVSRGFNQPRLLGYAESHDEERLMYNNVVNGNTTNPSHNVQDLNTALSRMSALGAVSVMIPGPKMIWHFGDLGMDNSIFTCSNGSVNLPNGSNGDGCKLDTKPQPQWTENWIADALRSQIYNDWAILHTLKVNEDVFEGDYTITSSSSNFTPKIEIFDNSISSSELNYVIIYSNFGVSAANIFTDFPPGVTSTWYDLMDPTGTTTVSNGTAFINIPPGQFRIFGNQPSQALSIDDENFTRFSIYPNPANTAFNVNMDVTTVEVYDLTGKVVKSFAGDFTRNDSFDISSLNTGVYIVRVENSNQQSMTSKLVKL